MNLRILLTLCLLNGILMAQSIAPIDNVKEAWNTVDLNNDCLEAINNQWHQVRVIQINGQDTLELPYYKASFSNKTSKDWEILSSYNKSYKDGKTFISFKSDTLATELFKVDLPLSEYDFEVQLEGSTDGKEWYQISTQRILKTKLPLQSYLYNWINTSKVQFPMYRLIIPQEITPTVRLSVQRWSKELKREKESLALKTYNIQQEKQTTIIDFELKQHLPVHYIELDLSFPRSYFRNYTISLLVDSIQKANGEYHYNYKSIQSGVIHPLDSGRIAIPGTWMQKGRIIIDNKDNQALNIKALKCFRNPVVINFHSDSPAPALFMISDEYQHIPSYDIQQNQLDLELLNPCTLGPLNQLIPTDISIEEKTSGSKVLLYALIGFIATILMFFAIKMMKSLDR